MSANSATNDTRAIWRGYKEIKDAGGWPSLIFASVGVYRFCKYRTVFGEILFSRLRQIRSSLEVAADTLHPEWRDLLRVIQQETLQVYHGHPHDWVTVATAAEPALPLASTYDHLKVPDGFQYRFIEECVLDTVFTEDPRRVPDLDPDICSVCSGRQSDITELNQCACFPALFGGVRTPPPVQIFRTPNGKNNGVIARCVSSPYYSTPHLAYPLTPRLSSMSHLRLTTWPLTKETGNRPRHRPRRIYRPDNLLNHRPRRNDRGIPRPHVPNLPRNHGQLYTVHQPLVSTEYTVPAVLLARLRADHCCFQGGAGRRGGHGGLFGPVLEGVGEEVPVWGGVLPV
jgi:hypothetical protein